MKGWSCMLVKNGQKMNKMQNFLKIRKLQEKCYKSRVLTLKSDKNSQSYDGKCKTLVLYDFLWDFQLLTSRNPLENWRKWEWVTKIEILDFLEVQSKFRSATPLREPFELSRSRRAWSNTSWLLLYEREKFTICNLQNPCPK